MPRPNRGPYLKFLPERAGYYIFWSECGVTRKRSTGTTDRKQAEATLAQFIHQRHLFDTPKGPSDPESFLISDALELYGELHAPTVAAPERIGYAIDALLAFWGQKTVAEVTKANCKRYARERRRSPGTVRRELTTLRAALNFSHEENRLKHVPSVWLPEEPQGRDRWLRRSEAAMLLNAARTGRADVRLYLPLFILLGLYTGARKEAILSLRWPQVDLEQGVIDFNPPGSKQTNKRRARLPIPERLMTFLRLAKRRGSDLGYVVHCNGARIKDVKKAFATACERAGLAEATPHTLRHTCGTWMAQRGVPLFEIGGWLGQTHERTVILYAHHHTDFLVNAKRAADRR